MVSKEQLAELRAANVKSYRETPDSLEIEFFPVAPPVPLFEPERFSPTTLVPPPEDEVPPTERPAPERNYKVPPALAAILSKPSVS